MMVNPSSAQPALELVEASRVYHEGAVVTALFPTSISIADASMTAVVGPSGSGKSTMLNLLGLLDRPSAGDVKVHGTSIDSLSKSELVAFRGHQIGFVFQSFHLVRGRSVIENCSLGLLYAGVRRAERMERSEQVLTRLGLDHRLDNKIETLSGGERQRVAIARALVSGAKILLCDEPTGNLDLRTGDSVLAELNLLNNDGFTVIIVTHDPKVAERCGRTVSVEDGRVIADTDTEVLADQ